MKAKIYQYQFLLLLVLCGLSSTVWAGQPVNRVNTRQPLVALTFDDGPHASNTPQLLDLFKKHDVKATFFVTGKNLKQYPELAKRMIAEGHEVGNHTVSHRKLTKLKIEEVRAEIEGANKLIKETVGKAPAVFRAPMLSLNKNVYTVLNGMPAINASKSTGDWQRMSPEKILAKATEGTKAGDIILMHTFSESTIKAMPQMIKALQDKGLKCVTVSELMAAKDKQNYDQLSSGNKTTWPEKTVFLRKRFKGLSLRNFQGWADLKAEHNYKTWAEACRAGNPNSELAFNRGARQNVAYIRLNDAQTYTAGEANNIGSTPETHPAPEGMKWQMLTYLGKKWGKGDNPRYSTDKLIPYLDKVNALGGCVTFDVPLSSKGTIPESFMKVLRELSKNKKQLTDGKLKNKGWTRGTG